ncbi:MAG: hypothetical protein RLZ55_1345 [Actinomycetota bacterium]
MPRTTATQSRSAHSGPAQTGGVELSMAYRRWGALGYTMALRGTGDPSTAREITAQAFAEAWRPGLPAEDLKVALTAAVRRATMAARAKNHRELAAEGGAIAAPADDIAAAALLDRLVVRDDLTDLGDPDRTVMLQLINAGADRQAIAARLGLDSAEVATIIARSLRSMQTRLAGSRGRR